MLNTCSNNQDGILNKGLEEKNHTCIIERKEKKKIKVVDTGPMGMIYKNAP